LVGAFGTLNCSSGSADPNSSRISCRSEPSASTQVHRPRCCSWRPCFPMRPASPTIAPINHCHHNLRPLLLPQAVAYEFSTEFGPVLAERMAFYGTNPQVDTLNRVKVRGARAQPVCPRWVIRHRVTGAALTSKNGADTRICWPPLPERARSCRLVGLGLVQCSNLPPSHRVRHTP